MESIDKATQTQIANIEKSTGKKLDEWIAIVKNVVLPNMGSW
jgi:hypothetical protein